MSRSPDQSPATTLEFSVPDMDCPSCAAKITASVEELEGIDRVEPRVTDGTVRVVSDRSRVTDEAIADRVTAAGYRIEADTETTFSVPEMDCASCAAKIESALEDIPGVREVETQPASGRVTVATVGAGGTDRETLLEAVASAGYEATVLEANEADGGRARAVWRTPRAIGTALGGLFLVAGMTLQFLLPAFDTVVVSSVFVTATAADGLLVAAAAIAGAPILRNGYYSARTRNLDIDFLMSAGIIGSVLTGHPFEGAILAVLFSVAQLLERFSMDRARDSLRELMELSPETATVRRDGEERTVPVETLEIGDRVIVRPGEKLPADGVVRAGESAIDQSPVTGESLPVDAGVGTEVYAGTIAETGYLEVDVTAESDESTIARIVALVAEADRERTDREQFVDRFAAVYTPIVVALAIVLAVGPPLLAGGAWGTWFLRGLTLLVIACPCAFVISTPVSVVSGITSAARNGVLIKGGRYLEAVGESDVLAVDKTGTLTTGELSVTDVIALEGVSDREVLEVAGALEARSEHPIGEAILEAAANKGVEISDNVSEFEALTGRGVRATVDGTPYRIGKPAMFDDQFDLGHTHMTDGGQVLEGGAAWAGTGSDFEAGAGVGSISGTVLDGPDLEYAPDRDDCDREHCLDLERTVRALESAGKTVVLVGCADRLLGAIAIADRVRPEAAWAVSRLQQAGTQVVMLTGDNERTAHTLAAELGIEESHAGLLPEEKLEWIRRLESEYGEVAMLGDGINDAPALATASVGIAMGAAGTDTALETADVALMGDDLSRLPYLYALSRQANGVIRQNIWASLGVKAVLAAGAPFGIVTVIHAVVIGDMGMSLGVTGNAMRLAGIDPEEPPAT